MIVSNHSRHRLVQQKQVNEDAKLFIQFREERCSRVQLLPMVHYNAQQLAIGRVFKLEPERMFS